jgi:hypothetical protein
VKNLALAHVSAPKSQFSHHPLSNDAPLPPQPPLGKAQREQHQEDQRKIPQILGLAHGHASLREGNGGREFAEVGGLPILSTGLGGEVLQQIAILFGVEILGDAVHALKG